MKKKILCSVVTALLLLSNSITAFADDDLHDFAVEKPVVDKPSPYEDAMLTPYRFNNLISVTQNSPDFYTKTPIPGRKNPVRATSSYSWGESYKVIEGWDTESKFFEYDAQGNLVSMNEFLSDGALHSAEQYTYDAQGNLLSDAGNGYSTQYTYDKQGRLLSEINTYGADFLRSEKYTYDAPGNVLTYTYTDSSVNSKDTYTRDARGNVLTHTYGSSKEQHTLTYDAQGNLLTDSVLFNYNPEAWEKAQYTYDAMGNLLTYDDTLYAGEDNFNTMQYTYDALGNVLTHTYYNSIDAVKYTDQLTYDAMGNLLTHTHESIPQSDRIYTYPVSFVARYTYDAMGNLLTYTCDAERAHSKYWSKSKQYTYDAMGNLLTYTYTNIEHVSSGNYKPGYIETEKWQYFYE